MVGNICCRIPTPQEKAILAWTFCITHRIVRWSDEKKKDNKQGSAQSVGAIEYTDCISVEEQDSTASVLDMTLNNLMMRLQ